MRNEQSTNRVAEYAAAMPNPAEVVHDYPITSMLVLFGVGVGIGMLVGSTLCEPLVRSMTHTPTFAEKLSRSINDAIHSVMPEAVTRHLPA